MTREEIRRLTDEQLEARLSPDDLYAAEAFRRARDRDKVAKSIMEFHTAMIQEAIEFIAKESSFSKAAKFSASYLTKIGTILDQIGIGKNDARS